MSDTSQHPTAIVCGSDMPIGAALVARLRAAGVRLVTVDFAPVTELAGALHLHGDLGLESTWHTIATSIREQGLTPTWLVSALHTSDAPLSLFELPQVRWDAVNAHNVRSAYLACKYLMPLMAGGDGAVVLLASVYAGWDVRAEAAAQSAGDAGLLALARALALGGGPAGLRVNTVCYGLVARPEQVARDERIRQAVGRVPLGRAASPDDVVDAVEFLLSADARHITGSTLVVDGGQSLQSWSNAPE